MHPDRTITPLLEGLLTMARACSVCVHDDHEAIDAALVERIPYREIGRRFDVSKDAIARHKLYVSAALVAVQQRQAERGAEMLVDRMERLYGRCIADPRRR